MITPEHSLLSLPALRQLEQNAEAAGLQLMQRAAQAIAKWCQAHIQPAAAILVAAGPAITVATPSWRPAC